MPAELLLRGVSSLLHRIETGGTRSGDTRRLVFVLLQGKAEFFPLVEAAQQGPYAVDSVLAQLHGHFGCRCFAGTGAIEDDVAVTGNLTRTLHELLGREADCAGQNARIRQIVQRMTQVDDERVLARVQHALELDRLEARGSNLLEKRLLLPDAVAEQPGD